MARIPDDLFSVNGTKARELEQLFAHNERLTCMFDGPDGSFASVMMGAMIVAGDEMGQFHLVSTVVVLFEPGRADWLERLRPGSVLKVEQVIGRRRSAGG